MSSSDGPCHDRSLSPAHEQFIIEWGRMSSSWGINRTMAQIHALLFCTGCPMSVDDIMGHLHISRGNASMNLRDLVDWGIVRRFRESGERRDLYISEDDPWQMVARVVRERKRRELDPTAAALREVLSKIPQENICASQEQFRKKVEGLLEIFDLVDAVYQQAFATDQAFNDAVGQFRRQFGSPEPERP
ncbi:MAG: hypothetical protein SNJ76_08450 [Fimbriimonadaceae bacterium]